MTNLTEKMVPACKGIFLVQDEAFRAQNEELKMFEKRYRRLFESAKDGILILDFETGMISDVNPFLIKMLGYDKEMFLQKKLWDISAFKYIDYSKQLYEVLQEKEYIRYENIPLETFNGKQVNVEFVSNVYLVDGEKVVQCNIRDITEQVKREQKLNNEINVKQALLKELQHRTKNSFTLISSLVNLTIDGTGSMEAKSAMGELSLRIKSISDLYTLLHETKSFDAVDLKTYSRKVIESMNGISNGHTIRQDVQNIEVTTICAASIGMILVELLTNAIKYAFPGKPEGDITVKIVKTEQQIQINVDDNGIGLRDDFDINKTESLGLHIVELLVNQLEGSIQFKTGGGTRIQITIPAAP